MKYNLFSRTAPVFAVGLTVSLLLAGCGGGGHTDGSSVRDANGFVTRGEEDKYSADALVLASREASEASIPTTTASAVQEDLIAVRARYPQLADVHATPADDLKSVLVTVAPGSPVASAWGQGQVHTDLAALDNLLSGYKATEVSTVYAGTSSTVFVVRFTDPLNTAKVRQALDTQVGDTSGIKSVAPNVTIGDGDQITRVSRDKDRVYTFSYGFGDCTAGCINRHTWAVTLASDGTTALDESGAPLPVQ